MAAHTGMELHGRDGHAITIYDDAANDRSMAATKPIRYGVATTCNGADDDALYGGAGNDVVDASTRDGSDTISRRRLYVERQRAQVLVSVMASFIPTSLPRTWIQLAAPIEGPRPAGVVSVTLASQYLERGCWSSGNRRTIGR
jgi:hypothetical protein